MDDNEKITLFQWNELTVHKKELLRTWAIQNGYELDIVPGLSGSFDPSCEYAALLTKAQIIQFIHSRKAVVQNQKVKVTQKKSIDALWNNLKQRVE